MAQKWKANPTGASPIKNGVFPAPPHDKTGHTWHHDNQLLFEYAWLGGEEALTARDVTGFASGMPRFGDVLTDGEVWNFWRISVQHSRNVFRTSKPVAIHCMALGPSTMLEMETGWAVIAEPSPNRATMRIGV